MWRFQGWWERHPAALYGTNDQAGTLPFYVRAQEGHFYAECSNRGICNRENGLCECMTGYEGAACNRTVCINDCSGHGTCETITEITPSHLHYRLWDADKTQYCQCDGGYFGMDCSQRQCMTNDDPLTVTTTRDDYNNGLPETGEVQHIDIRCPFYGEMLDPSVSITYQDDQFGDNYETGRFDPTDTTATATVMGLLKSLPNQVLADFTVDGTTVVSKITGVSAVELEADSWYQWRVTFDERMGDVPLLSGTPYFKCKGGAEIDAGQRGDSFADMIYENIGVTYAGDGPEEDLTFVFSNIVDDGTNPDTFDYLVQDSTGSALGAAETGLGFATFSAGVALTNAATFSREASKVLFDFPKGGDDGNQNRGAGATDLTIKIHTVPTITVNNRLFTLDTGAPDIVAPGTRDLVSANTLTVQRGASGATDPTYDQKIEVLYLDTTADSAAWFINDEFIGYIELAAGTLEAALIDGASVPALLVNGITFSGNAVLDTGTATVGDAYIFWQAKTVEAYIVDGPDTLSITFTDNQPPSLAINLVIKITTTSASVDRYAWKVAGDTDFQTDSVNNGFAVPASGTPTQLPTSFTYVHSVYPDDPMRSGVPLVEVSWLDGPDLDGRICESENGHTTNGKYYIQIGSNGLNDAPECSDRGICDYSSGICKCFKGYAGIDCHEQNALAMGQAFTA